MILTVIISYILEEFSQVLYGILFETRFEIPSEKALGSWDSFGSGKC